MDERHDQHRIKVIDRQMALAELRLARFPTSVSGWNSAPPPQSLLSGTCAVELDRLPELVMKNDADEPIHEKADTRTRGADHLGKRFLAHFRDHGQRFGFLAKVGQQQEKPGKAFFT